MTSIFKMAIAMVLATFIIIGSVLGGTYWLVTSTVEDLKVTMKEDVAAALLEQKAMYEEKMAIIVKKSNEKAVQMFEKSLKTAENTYRIYTSEYINQMADRAALAKAKLKENPSLSKSKELYEDLMAKTQIENYEYGVGHNVVKDVNKPTLFEKYQGVRKRLEILGFSEDKINEIILQEKSKNDQEEGQQ